MIMVVESWVNERATNQVRGQVLSLYMITNYLGQGLGQFMMLVGDPAQFQLFIIASMVYSFALVPILLSGATAPKPASPKRMRFGALVAISPVGVVGTISAGLTNSSLNGMGAVFARGVGLSIAEVSTFMASAIFGGMLIQFPIGRLSDKFDRRTVLVVTSLGSALSAAALIWATHQPVLVFILIAGIYGGFCFTIYPLSASQVNDLSDPDNRVQVAAGLLIAYGIGASLGPTVSAQAMALYGPSGFLYFVIGVNVALMLFTILRIFQRRKTSKVKTAFLPLGGVGSSSKQLYTAALENEQKTSN